MAFTRWGYEFDGAHSDPNMLRGGAGVYVIWCKNGEFWSILDVGESENVLERINNHDRADCWTRNCSGTIWYSATYIADQSQRVDLENRIRIRERVICGER